MANLKIITDLTTVGQQVATYKVNTPPFTADHRHELLDRLLRVAGVAEAGITVGEGTIRIDREDDGDWEMIHPEVQRVIATFVANNGLEIVPDEEEEGEEEDSGRRIFSNLTEDDQRTALFTVVALLTQDQKIDLCGQLVGIDGVSAASVVAGALKITLDETGTWATAEPAVERVIREFLDNHANTYFEEEDGVD